MPNLGKLTPINVKEVWSHEAHDFTPWLAEDPNIELLSETLGLTLEVTSVEKNVGRFFADIVCKNINDGSTVLIENQLERTDHKHLGQIFTYAAGLDAVTIIWVSPQFTDEHKAAIDWLNKITSSEFSFFGIELEVWQIGASDLAPKFSIVSQPNDWTRAMQNRRRSTNNSTNATTGASDATDLQLQKLSFWEGLVDYLSDHNSPIRCQKPSLRHWMWHAVGKTGVAQSSNIVGGSNDTKEVRVQFVIHDDPDGSRLEHLEELLPTLADSLGERVQWTHGADSSKRSKISISHHIDWTDEAHVQDAYLWLDQTHRKLKQLIAPHLNTIKF